MGNDFKVFVAIHDQPTISALMSKLVGLRYPIFFRDHEEPKYGLEAIKTTSENRFMCQWTEAPPKSFQSGVRCSWSFHVGEEKYIFECKPEVINGSVFLTMESVFRIQKRQTFRYSIPLAEAAQTEGWLKVKDVNQSGVTMRLLDVHTEGFGLLLESSHPPYKNGDMVTVEIRYSTQPAFLLHGVVRQLRQNSTQNYVMGLKMTGVNPETEGNVIDFIHYLRKNFQSRKAG